MVPVLGRSIAPLRSGTSTAVSSSSKSLLSPAPADCSVLNNWLSCWIGSNRLPKVSTKNAIVPSVTTPSIVIHPPMPTTNAVVPSPASSITGRYQAWMNTESMCAW